MAFGVSKRATMQVAREIQGFLKDVEA
jgi:hypothetical protein